MTTHELKTHSEPFTRVMLGIKRAEFRKNDRGFELGDRLILREWVPDTEVYTGAHLRVNVTDITTGYGIPEGYCMMSFEVLP